MPGNTLVKEYQDKKLPLGQIFIFLFLEKITITQSLLAKLLANNTAVITCDNTHHPAGMLLSRDGNTLQSQKFQAQIDASVPLKKQLWQQTVMAKIANQAALLAIQREDNKLLLHYAKEVKSGDSENHEAKAAAHYLETYFPGFSRIPPGTVWPAAE